MDESTAKKKFNELDAILVSKRFAPPRCIEIIASVVQEMFKNTEVIYGDDSSVSKCRECLNVCELKESWIKIIKILKNNWNEKDFVYSTDMGVAILIRKIDVPELEWKYMVLTLLKNIHDGMFGYGTQQDTHKEIRTIPYDISKLRSVLLEKGIDIGETDD